jgi:peptide deformylase
MDTLKHLIEEDYRIVMDDVIREGHPTLREVAQEIEEPLDEEVLKLGQKMMEFLENSQNTEVAEELNLRGGVGLAAPQLDISKRLIAVLIPSDDEENSEPLLKEVMFNPKVLSHSVQELCLRDGEGCLSVDREVPGYVVRAERIWLSYTNSAGEKMKIKIRGYEAVVVQHEIDHLNGIMFYDRINETDPYQLKQGVKVI